MRYDEWHLRGAGASDGTSPRFSEPLSAPKRISQSRKHLSTQLTSPQHHSFHFKAPRCLSTHLTANQLPSSAYLISQPHSVFQRNPKLLSTSHNPSVLFNASQTPFSTSQLISNIPSAPNRSPQHLSTHVLHQSGIDDRLGMALRHRLCLQRQVLPNLLMRQYDSY